MKKMHKSNLSPVKKSYSSKQILQNKLKMAAAGERIRGLSVQVKFTVSGGVHGEYFYESIEFDSDGNIQYEREDQLLKKKREKTIGQADRSQLNTIFKDLFDSGIMDLKKQDQQIPPDTVVGFLTLRSGKKEKTVLLPMDEFEPEKPQLTSIRLKLYSGKVLNIPTEFVPKKIMKAIDSITKMPKVMIIRS